MNNKMALLLIMLASSHIVIAEHSPMIEQPVDTTAAQTTGSDLDLGSLGIDMDNFDPENQEQMDAFLKALEKNPEALEAIQSAAEEEMAGTTASDNTLENEIKEAVEAEAAAEDAEMVADEAKIVAEEELDDVVDAIENASQE